MFNRRAAAALLFTIAASGCGNNPAVPFIGPPTPSSPSPTPTPSPVGATPTPTPTATPTPTPAPVVPAPALLAFTGLGTPNARSVSVTESGYAGAFSEVDSCAGIATIATATPKFTVTPTAVGTCSITILDISQRNVAVAVTVTTSGLVVQDYRSQQ